MLFVHFRNVYPYRRGAMTRKRMIHAATGWTIAALGVLAMASRAHASLHTRVSLRFDNRPAKEALEALGKQAGVQFRADDELFRGAAAVHLEVQDAEAGRVADRILRPRGLGMDLSDPKTVRIVRLEPTDEFRVKREEDFRFKRAPVVTRHGDEVTIAFETEGWCDVTVAIEGADGRILRHLASGVLGPRAPEPFQWNAKAQTLVWDGKDDRGAYVDNKDAATVRVSLGLKPRFERTLFWSPKKRIATAPPLLQAAPEGVYMFEGFGVDHLRLFTREGEYAKTIVPPPAEAIPKIVGLPSHVAPQTGQTLPVMQGFVQSTLLTSGDNALWGAGNIKFGMTVGARAMAVRPMAKGPSRIALGFIKLNRLAGDGTSGGLPFEGPTVSFHTRLGGMSGAWEGNRKFHISPTSMAFSPDGRYLYLTGYLWTRSRAGGAAYHGVYRLDYEANVEPEVFAGVMTQEGAGSGDSQFNVPTSVAVDGQGRVYVSDYLNDRIQVFSPDGTLLRSLPANRPAQVSLHAKTGEIHVFSWPVSGYPFKRDGKETMDLRKIPATLTRLGTLEEPAARPVSQTLPLGHYDGNHMYMFGQIYSVALDSWAETPTLWAVGRRHELTVAAMSWNPAQAQGQAQRGWTEYGARILQEQDGEWKQIRHFGEDAAAEVARTRPPWFSAQRLYVNPRTERLYLGEPIGFQKSFRALLEIDPNTGRQREIQLPFDPEDVAFDLDGYAYLRTDTLVVRYDSTNWREIPWDYGEEHRGVGFARGGGGRNANVISALPLPGGARPVNWNMGGLHVTPKGFLAVSVTSRARERGPGGHNLSGLRRGVHVVHETEVGYEPLSFPGRWRWGEVHVWDKHGKPVRQDVVPGLRRLDGIALSDRDHSVYAHAHANRIFPDGTPYFRGLTGTAMKFPPEHIRVLSPGGATIPLQKGEHPARPMEIDEGWVEGAEWFYGGVGYAGFNRAAAVIGGGCVCWNFRSAFDYFERSFLPELDHFSVAVLDPAGNLILRVGRYGNVDDGVPLVKEGPSSGPGQASPPNPRSIGGDETAFIRPAYLATHTDRRLFVADHGNARIASVRLGYHAEETVALKTVPDQAAAKR